MQWLMWLVTLATLALLHRVTRNAPVEAQATLALGALLLLAYVSGTIARRLRLPRITGYLVAGWIAGPGALELVSGPVLDALTPFATGTLFLIAFAVGNALSTDFLRTERRATIFRITAGAMVVPFVAVTLVVLTVSPWFPLTAHQRFRDALTVALALGTVSAVSSPAVTWPVITDAGAHGQLPHTTLEVSALQDFLGATLILLVIALAVPLGSRGTVTPGIAVQAVVAITGSIVAGVTLALASTQYLRVIQQHVGWALVVLALVASQIVWLGGLDAVLMGVAGGVALRAIAPE
ncbi:MAG TPA: cation:proton antiporter, partial [Gemmatimonadales bacterium]|nr:cation:proton antiporter [Gemmatimonadales bacterium]